MAAIPIKQNITWLHILKILPLDCMLIMFLIHVIFHANRMLFTFQSINLFFIYNFIVQKREV